MNAPLTPTQADEDALIARLRAGDDDAFTEMVRLYGPRLYATAKSILRDDDEAQDALQDAFVSAAGALDKFEGGSRLSTWLHRIAVNAALMRRRKLKPGREVAVEDLESLMPSFSPTGKFLDEQKEWMKPADLRLEQEQLAELVRQKIDELPETHRNVLILRDIQELSGAETAELLGISPNAAKVRLHRARLALRELLAPHLRRVTDG